MTEADGGIHLVDSGLAESSTVRAWRWSAGAFTPLGEAGPASRVGATAVYDRARRIHVYWGGSDSTTNQPSATLHEFDGVRWQVRAPR